jgi:Deacetylases, including yeast histone deacetylase and acetoin utilization protein
MVLLYYDPLFLQHDTGDHPENASRIIPSARQLNLIAVHFGCVRPSWEPLAPEALTRVHSFTYVDTIRNLAEGGGGILDHDTVLSPPSFDIARAAAGAVCDAVDKVVIGRERHAFCLIRPPGHHAAQNKGMGFCLFNNVALGARRAIDQHGLDRVLIVDWDVHHGNGTQEIFWEDGHVGFFSIHRYPFYPGTGAADEIGVGAGLGTKLNVPITFGTPRADYLQQFNEGLELLATKIRPQLILISAGFDAHRLDPIGSLGLESEDFALMTRSVLEVANTYSGGRVVSALEGGYNPIAVAECVESHVQQLLASE